MSRFVSPPNTKMTHDKTMRKSVDACYGTHSLKNSKVPKNSRKSAGTPSLSLQKLSDNYELANIEAEYIRNLQQQIYYLELEANYLRSQSTRASAMQPKMTAEAERLIHKLRLTQSELEGVNIELHRKESSISIINNEKLKLMEKLNSQKEAQEKEKNLLTDEIIKLKKNKVILERDLSRKDDALNDLRNENDKHLVVAKNSEMMVTSLKSQLEQRVDQHKMTQISLEERRTDLVTTQAQLKALEEKFYNSTPDVSSVLSQDLREEIRAVHQKLKENEICVDQERLLKDKVMSNLDSVIKENALLHQNVIELQSQLNREEKLRHMGMERHTKSLTEYASMQDQCKQLNFDLHHTQDLLRTEKGRIIELTGQLTSASGQDIKLSTSRSRVAELENMYENLKEENDELLKDKMILADHVADIQSKLSSRDAEVMNLREAVQRIEGRGDLELSMHQRKWEEFGRLAESMQQLSTTMFTRRSVNDAPLME